MFKQSETTKGTLTVWYIVVPKRISLNSVALVLGGMSLFFSAGEGFAACTSTQTSVICKGTASGANEFLAKAGNQTVTANDFTLNNGRLRVQTDGNINFNGDNVTINNGDGSLGASMSNGVIHINTTGSGKNSTINISDSVITVTKGTAGIPSQGVTAQTNHDGSNSGSAIINAVNVSVDMQTEFSRAGFNANSAGAGNATVDMSGGYVKTNSTVSSIDDYYAGVRAKSGSGNARVNIHHGAWVESFQKATGVSAQSGGNGSAQVMIAADAGGAIEEDPDLMRAILTLGDEARGVYAAAKNGNIEVKNLASMLPVAIETRGNNANGVSANIVDNGTGSIVVDNQAAILTNGSYSNGIFAQVGSGTIELTNTSSVQALGANANGVSASTDSGDVTITNSGYISSNQAQGIYINSTGNSRKLTIENQENGSVTGAIGVKIAGITDAARITNAGIIGSSSDHAIDAAVQAAGLSTVDNTGTMTGFLTGAASAIELNNLGTWNLRNFAATAGQVDAYGDPVRDTLAVARSDFGSAGGNHVNNSGTISLQGAGVATVATLDNTGEYLPFGNSLNAMVLGGPIQGQILGVQSLTNSGVIDLTGGSKVAGNVLVISGGQTPGVDGGGVFIANGGTLRLNTVLNEGGANSHSDVLVLDSTMLGEGPALITINKSGNGGLTVDNGIALVEVLNKRASADGVFRLQGDYQTQDGKPALVGGAYAYTLEKNGVNASGDGNWYLRSTMLETPVEPGEPDEPSEPAQPRFQPGDPSYEAYPQALLALNSVPTLQQRVGNRFWAAAGGTTLPAQGSGIGVKPQTSADHTGIVIEGNGVWGRVEGAYHKIKPRSSTSDTTYDQNIFRLQIGVDRLLKASENANLVGGLAGHYVHGKTDTQSPYGDGDIDTDGYGIGGTLTWYDNAGSYLDGQVRVTWYDSNLRSRLAGKNLIRGNNGFGYATSIEGGKRIALGSAWSMTPQAQLVYSNVDFDTFTDPFDARISNGQGESLQGRLGVTIDHENSRFNIGGASARTHVYGLANLHYEFLGGTKVNVSGTTFASSNDRLWASAGVGGSYNWDDDKYSIYGEGLVNTSLKQFADSYSVVGRVGFRMRW